MGEPWFPSGAVLGVPLGSWAPSLVACGQLLVQLSPLVTSGRGQQLPSLGPIAPLPYSSGLQGSW